MKKFLAMLMTAAMLTVSVFQTVSFAAFSDVDDSNPYKSAISALNTLSVIEGYEDGTFKPDGAITRAEFTKMIVYMLGLEDITYSSYSFSDIDQSNWARNYIQTAYDRGIIVGFDDGTFQPNDPVTYAQALKMVVCTLGYEQFATGLSMQSDGWADKYIQEAGQLGLTKGVVANGGYYDSATRGMITQILYNALEIDMYEYNGYNWYQTTKTLLNDYLKVKELKGTLVGVDEYVTEDSKVNLLEQQMSILDNKDEEIIIDYSTYTDNAADLTKYLGSTIRVYYRQLNENDERRLISIDADSTKNSIIELSYDSLNSFEGSTIKYYDENSKPKTAKLRNEDLTVRYNGKIVSADSTVTLTNPVTKADESFTRQQAMEKWLNTGTDYTVYGSVTLTDNGDDGTVDMVQIYDYDVIVAYSAPTSSDYRITDKLVTGNYLILDPQSANYEYTITKNGETIPVTSIKSNDVVLYAKSLDGSLYTLLVSDKTVKGNISSMTGDNKRMTIDGASYDIGDKCASYILDKSNKELKVGVSGTFYLDAFDTAVFGTLEEASVSPYAYIIDAYLDPDEGNKPYITVYAPSVSTSETVSYPLKSKIKLNGSSTKAETAIDKIQEAAAYAGDESEYAEKIYGAGKYPQNTQHAQPARVTITNKEVTDVVIMTSDEIQSQNEDKEKIVKCRELGEYTYSSNSFSQGGKTSFSVNSSTTVIYVPSDRKQKTKYARKTVSSTFSSNEQYYVEAYDINSSRMAGLIIYYGNNGTLTTVKKDTDFSVVATLPEADVNKNDDEVQSFSVYTGAASTTRKWLTYSPTEFSDVVVGDVIQFAYDSDNLIQGRINNIRYSDVEEVLNGKENNGQRFNWEDELTPGEENHYQKSRFDYRFKRAGTSEDETYTSSTLGTVPNSRAVVFNVSQVLPEENKIYVTQSGFEDVDGIPQLDDSDYEEINVGSSTRILRMDKDGRNGTEISPYVADTTANLTINDLKDAKNYGVDCSKILVLMSKGNAKMILIYE